MSSRSSSSAPRFLPVGRIAGHRGRSGELTVRVAGSDASPWEGVRKVWIGGPGGPPAPFDVEASRTYRDRLVLKLRGVDDANTAAGLRGRNVQVERDEAPVLAPGEHWVAELIGSVVIDENDGRLGTVTDVRPTGAVELLVVRPEDGSESEEILIPMASEFLLEVATDRGEIRVRLPDGLLELNRE